MARPPPEAPPCAPPCAPPITPSSPGPGAHGWNQEVVCIQPSRSTTPPENMEHPPPDTRNVGGQVFFSFDVIMYVWAGKKKKKIYFLCHDTQINLSFQGATLIPISPCLQRAPPPPDRGKGIGSLPLKMQPQTHLHKSLISVTPSVLKRQKTQKALRVIKSFFFFLFAKRQI